MRLSSQTDFSLLVTNIEFDETERESAHRSGHGTSATMENEKALTHGANWKKVPSSRLASASVLSQLDADEAT